MSGTETTQAAAAGIAFAIQNDPELVALRARLAQIDEDMADAERRIPLDVRDIETIESHVDGHTTGELKAFVADLLVRYSAMSEYVALMLIRRHVEGQIDARRDQLVPAHGVH